MVGICYLSMMEYFASFKKCDLEYLRVQDTTQRASCRDNGEMECISQLDPKVIKCVTQTHTYVCSFTNTQLEGMIQFGFLAEGGLQIHNHTVYFLN